MNQALDKNSKGHLVERVHLLAFVIDLVFTIVTVAAYFLFGPAANWPFSLPSEDSRRILVLVIALAIVPLHIFVVKIYSKMKRQQGSFTAGQLALGLLRGWPGDRPDKLPRTHRVLVIADRSDANVKDESDSALREISGAGLEPVAFDPATDEQSWDETSAGVSAIYLLRSRNMVDAEKWNWIFAKILKLSKTTQRHSPVVEADMYAEHPSAPIFYRVHKEVFPYKMHVLLSRAIDRGSLMSSQAGFNRFAFFLILVVALSVFMATRLPPLFRTSHSPNQMPYVTDLINSQHGERERMDQCFPFATALRDNSACGRSLDEIRAATRASIDLALSHIVQTKYFSARPRLTVWRSAQYRGRHIIFAAGASEDPQAHVFMDEKPPGPASREDDRDSIIAGALVIRGWVLWRKTCPSQERERDAAWTMDGRVEGHCDQDGRIETRDSSIYFQDTSHRNNVPLSALMCYGDSHGNGACIAVTDNAEMLQNESLRQEMASWTTLIATRPTSLLFDAKIQQLTEKLIQ